MRKILRTIKNKFSILLILRIVGYVYWVVLTNIFSLTILPEFTIPLVFVIKNFNFTNFFIGALLYGIGRDIRGFKMLLTDIRHLERVKEFLSNFKNCTFSEHTLSDYLQDAKWLIRDFSRTGIGVFFFKYRQSHGKKTLTTRIFSIRSGDSGELPTCNVCFQNLGESSYIFLKCHPDETYKESASFTRYIIYHELSHSSIGNQSLYMGGNIKDSYLAFIYIYGLFSNNYWLLLYFYALELLLAYISTRFKIKEILLILLFMSLIIYPLTLYFSFQNIILLLAYWVSIASLAPHDNYLSNEMLADKWALWRMKDSDIWFLEKVLNSYPGVLFDDNLTPVENWLRLTSLKAEIGKYKSGEYDRDKESMFKNQFWREAIASFIYGFSPRVKKITFHFFTITAIIAFFWLIINEFSSVNVNWILILIIALPVIFLFSLNLARLQTLREEIDSMISK